MARFRIICHRCRVLFGMSPALYCTGCRRWAEERRRAALLQARWNAFLPKRGEAGLEEAVREAEKQGLSYGVYMARRQQKGPK